MDMKRYLPVLASLSLGLVACSSASSATGGKLTIVDGAGDAPTGVAGDAIQLKLVEVDSSGATTDLPDSAAITWSGVPTVKTLDPNSSADALPSFGAAPTAVFIDNTGRSDDTAALENVLFLLDPGTKGGSVELTATVTGGATGTAKVSIPVGASLEGDASNGASVYAANCAVCHGSAAAGSDDGATKSSYVIAGMTYGYPAPGLNAASGNLASDPTWNAALLAYAARADADNNGVTLRVPMPSWMSAPITTQEYADIYAWLKTQNP